MAYDFEAMAQRARQASAQSGPVEEDRPWYSDAYEVGRQVAAGAVVDLPRMAGQGLRWMGDEAVGRPIVEAADERAKGWEPDMRGRGLLAETLIKGGRAVAPMAPALAAAFVPGGQWVAPAVSGALFGTSSAQDTEDKLRLQGVPDEDATAAGWRAGAIQGPLEGLATLTGMSMLKAARPLMGAAAGGTAGVAARMTDTAILKPLARGMGLNLLVQPTTEVVQDVGTELVERSYGAEPEDAWEIAKDSAQGGIGLTLLLGPFAAGGHRSRSRRAEAMKDALESPDTPAPIRAQARDLIVTQAERQQVAPADMDAWLDEQFMADDLQNSREQLRTAQDAVQKVSRYNDQSRREIRSAMRAGDQEGLEADAEAAGGVAPAPQVPGAAPLGDAAQPGPGAGTQGSAQVTQALQASQQAQGEREQQAALQAQAESEQAQPPSPEQEEMQRGIERQTRLAQDTLQFLQEHQISAKNAGVVVKEMMDAPPGLVTPSMAGNVTGMLKVGDVNGARKVLVEAKRDAIKAAADAAKAETKARLDAIKAEQKAQADAQKAAEKAAQEEQRATAKADAYEQQAAVRVAAYEKAAAADIAAERKATPAAPTTEGPPTPATTPTTPGETTTAAPPVATEQAALAEETPGQKLVAALEVRAGKKMPPVVKRRMYLLAGMDPDDGFMVSSPRTLDQVAAIEASATGGARLTREAIRKSLAPFGINREAMDRLGGMEATQDTAVDNTEEGGAFADAAVSEDNTPLMGDDLFNAAMSESEGSESPTMRVRSNLGSGILEPRQGQDATRLERQGSQMLARAVGTNSPRFAAAVERHQAAIQEATTSVISPEQEQRNAQITRKNEQRIAEMNAEVGARGGLRGLLPERLHGEIERAAEDFEETRVDYALPNDVAWTAMAPQEQARWVKAFVAWDADQMTTGTFNNIYDEIQDDTRRKAGEVRGQLDGAGARPERAGDAAIRGNAPANNVRGESQAPGVAKPGAARAQEATDGADTGKEQVANDAARKALPRPAPGTGTGAVQAGPQHGGQGREAGRDAAAGATRAAGDLQPVRLRDGAGGDSGQAGSQQDVSTEGARFSRRGATTISGVMDDAGQPVQATPTDLDTLMADPLFQHVVDQYTDGDMAHVIGLVQDWYVTDQPTSFAGAFFLLDGRPSMLLTTAELADPNLPMTLHHELGHALDLIVDGGEFSGRPELNLRVETDARTGQERVRGFGAVAREVVAQRDQDPNSVFGRLLGYPLDRTTHGDLDAEGVRQEVFAQLWLLYSAAATHKYIHDNMPHTARFMESTYEQVKTDPEYRATMEAAGKAGPRSQPSTGPGTAHAEGERLQGRPGQTPPRHSRRDGPVGARPAPEVRSLRFSRNPSRGTVQRTVAALPRKLQRPVNSSISTLGDWVNKGLDRIVFTGDLMERAAKAGITSTKKLERVLADRSARARALEREVERIADMYALVPERDRGMAPGSLNEVLLESTRTNKWPYGPHRDPEMGDKFDALSEPAQAQIRAIFAHGDAILEQKQDLVLHFTASEYDLQIAAETDPAEKAKLVKTKAGQLKRFSTLLNMNKGKPYAPIKRMGTHAVVGKSPEYVEAQLAGDQTLMAELEADDQHYHVTFVEGKGEGRTLRDRLLGEGQFGANVTLVERDKFSDEMYGGESMLGALTKLRARVQGGVSQDKKVSGAMLQMVSDMYLEALAENSARKSEMRRRGVAGEVDMLRSFTAQGRADAVFMSSVQSNPQVQDIIRAMRSESRAGGNEERKSELYNEVMARYIGSLEVDHSPVLNKLTRMTSIWFLATSPGYYLQNLTQPWMMTVPALAGRHGYGTSSSALWKAYGELGPVMQGTKLFDQQFDFDRVPADVRVAITELANRGRLDIGLETEMGEFKVGGDGRAAAAWNKIDKGMRLAVQKVESINRLSSAMAAYRLELGRPGATHASAVDYADRILSETHGNYDRFSAPRAFNSKAGKVMLQFRKFQLIQLTFYAKLINEAFTNPAERRTALKTLAYSLAHTGSMAGIMGLPGYAAASFVLGMLSGGDDEKFDLTNEIRKVVGDESIATLLLQGAPSLGGSGMDLSGKIGAGTMLSVMPFSNANLTTTQGAYEAAGTLLGGASLGMAAKMLDGVGQMMGGEWYKGIERTMPKGISDAMAAYRTYNDGLTRRNGDVILPAEDVSEVEALIKALGLQPSEQSVVYERRSRAYDTEERFKERSTRVKNDFIKAVKGGDAGARSQAMDAWRKLQETRRGAGYKPQALSELMKAPQAQAKRERDTVGGVQFNRSNQGFVRDMTSR